MTTTSEKILKTIKESHIKPEPRWKFLAKNDVLWVAFAVSLLVGAVSFGVILEMLANHDWDIYAYLHKSFFVYLIYSLPYVWFVCLAAVLSLAYYNFIHIRGWYHHRVYLVVLASVAGSVFLGSVFFSFGIGRQIDQVLTDNVPYYDLLKVDKKNLWVHPQDGLLGGTVEDVKTGNFFIIRDYKGNSWIVESSGPPPPPPAIRIGEKVKIIGREKDPGTFQADEIRDWDTKKVIQKQKHSEDDENSAGVCGKSEDGCDD
jgi:hypothetical protein